MAGKKTFAPASRNPSSNSSMAGMLDLIFQKQLQGMDDMLPAKVIAYNRTTNRARVQPFINMVTTDNRQIARAQVASVPVFQYGSGGFVLSFPVASGDTGWIKANDRDISLFKQSLKQTPPNTQRKHSFEDAMFFPDTLLAGVTIDAEDVNNAVFQNRAGTVKISLWGDKIKILASQGVGINGTPGAGALLDLFSTTKAFGLPQMSTAQKNAIPSPRKGFMVFDTDEDGISVFTSAGWS